MIFLRLICYWAFVSFIIIIGYSIITSNAADSFLSWVGVAIIFWTGMLTVPLEKLFRVSGDDIKEHFKK